MTYLCTYPGCTRIANALVWDEKRQCIRRTCLEHTLIIVAEEWAW